MNSKKVRQDTYLNIAGYIVPAAAGLLSIPILLAKLGNELFGILTIIWALVGYFGMFDLGVGKALTIIISKIHNKKINYKIGSIISSALLIAISMGLVSSIIVFITLIYFHNYVYSGFTLNTNELTFSSFIISIAIIPATLSSCFRGITEGNNNFLQSNINKTIVGSALFLFPLITTITYQENIGLIEISTSILLARLVGLIHFIVQTEIKTSSVTSSSISVIFSYGGWVTVSNIVGPIMVYGDRIILSGMIGTGMLSIYSIAQEICQRLLILPTAFGNAILPKIAEYPSNKTEILRAYQKGIYGLAISMGFILFVMHTALPYFLATWISQNFAESASHIINIMLIGVWFNSLSQSTINYLYAQGKQKEIALLHTLELIIFIASLYIFIPTNGIEGAAWIWTCRASFDLIALNYLFFFTKLDYDT